MGGRLNWSPKNNWVDNDPAHKGLPKFIEDIALALIRNGHTREQAIPIAINAVKRWAHAGSTTKTPGGTHVNADTVAKAQAALVEWEALKARNAARTAANDAKAAVKK